MREESVESHARAHNMHVNGPPKSAPYRCSMELDECVFRVIRSSQSHREPYQISDDFHMLCAFRVDLFFFLHTPHLIVMSLPLK
jgi:hypothetical protein